MKIVITGSLGHISKPLAKILIAKGHALTIVSSSPGRRIEIENMGAEAAIGSVKDTAFLGTAFAGADAVYTMVPPVSYMNPDMDPVEEFSITGGAYAGAIVEAGIKRVVNLSSWGAHRDNGTGGIVGTYYLEQIMNGMPDDISITHIRPASFYYNLLSFIPVIKYTGKISACYGGNDLTVLVAPEDIAVATAEELEQSTIGRNVRYVASDELTCTEVAHILGQSIGQPDLRWEVITKEQAMENLLAAGLPLNPAALLVELQLGHHHGLIAEDYLIHRPVPGKIKMRDYAREFALAFQKQVY